MPAPQGALREILDNIEQTRTVWHMQMDHQRNRVLRVNLLISMSSLGLMMGTLPAAFFGERGSWSLFYSSGARRHPA
jgi:hypothetical protein